MENPNWKDNPDVKLEMISYLGLPIHGPDGETFGTICVLDNKKRSYTAEYRELLADFKALLESDLELELHNQICQAHA